MKEKKEKKERDHRCGALLKVLCLAKESDSWGATILKSSHSDIFTTKWIFHKMDFPLKEKIPLKDYLWFKHTSFPHSYFGFLVAERVSVEPGHKMKFSVFLTCKNTFEIH